MSDLGKAPETSDRLAKVMARSGLCSRRDAEKWIVEGRVTVNGKKVMTPAFNVTPRDAILVDGTPLAERQGTRVWLYHKPPGLVVTEKDPEGRPTIFEALDAKGLPRVVTIGRLDMNTEGLMLLTNDGGLKRVLELPSTGWLRRYRVRAHGSITQEQLDRLKEGIEVEGISYGPIEAVLEREQGANVWLLVGLREGKNREVKNVLGALGLQVNRLIRVSFGPFQLGDLPVGAVEVVRARVLRDQLGKRLAEEAEVDFESELPESRAERPRPVQNRGTKRLGQTVEINQQRFRFIDREEEAEARTERPRPDRPGRFAPSRPTREARQPESGISEGRAPRKIHFDDGRESVAYVPKAPPRRAGAERDGPQARRFGEPGARPLNGRPRQEGADRPRRPADRIKDRPAPSGKPSFSRKEQAGEKRPGGGKPSFVGKAPRFDPDRASKGRPEGRRGDDSRPERSDKAPRRFGPRPSAEGAADRPRREPRPDRPSGPPGNNRAPKQENMTGEKRPARPGRPAGPTRGRPPQSGGPRPSRPKR